MGVADKVLKSLKPDAVLTHFPHKVGEDDSFTSKFKVPCVAYQKKA